MDFSLNPQPNVIIILLVNPLNNAMPWDLLYLDDFYKTMAMPSPMSPSCQLPSPLTSVVHHHVLDFPITPLNALDSALDQGDAGSNQNVTRPETPRRARTRTDTSLDALEHHFAS
jgi:hypothetical protein